MIFHEPAMTSYLDRQAVAPKRIQTFENDLKK